jgi:hypothetical protein
MTVRSFSKLKKKILENFSKKNSKKRHGRTSIDKSYAKTKYFTGLFLKFKKKKKCWEKFWS